MIWNTSGLCILLRWIEWYYLFVYLQKWRSCRRFSSSWVVSKVENRNREVYSSALPWSIFLKSFVSNSCKPFSVHAVAHSRRSTPVYVRWHWRDKLNFDQWPKSSVTINPMFCPKFGILARYTPIWISNYICTFQKRIDADISEVFWIFYYYMIKNNTSPLLSG